MIGLERKWPTKGCWFRLLVTLVGMCVVDMHFWDKHEKRNTLVCCLAPCVRIMQVSFVSVIFSVEVWLRGNDYLLPSDLTYKMRIEVNGEKNRPPTMKYLEKGKTLGQPYYVNCFICHKYLKEEYTSVYNKTCFCCKFCHMTICNNRKEHWNEAIGHDLTCEEEHAHA
jgi:hypothetical protein